MLSQGKCPVAEEARTLARIKRLPTYRQHATIGLLKNSAFPPAVIKSYNEKWKQSLADDFITCSALTNSTVSVQLEEDELTLWKITLSCSDGNCNVILKFTKVEMKIVSSKAMFDGLKMKLHDFLN